MQLQDFISGGFYINLDKRADKRDAFEAELARVGLTGLVQRLSAVTPDQLGYNVNDNGVYPIIGYARACTASHALAVQKAAELNWRNVLIFEDDAVFYTEGDYDPVVVINRALDALADIPWDLFYLGVDPGTRSDTLDEVAPNVIRLVEAICAHAYIVNSNIFAPVIEAAQHESHMDCYLSGRPNKYAAYPLCVMQRSDGYVNDIGPNFYGGMSVDHWLKQYSKQINKLY
jgi:hypothetical protein